MSNSLTRRNFLATSAAVPALPALLATAAEAGGPDAELLALIAECERVNQLAEERWDQQEAADERYYDTLPARPPCLRVRTGLDMPPGLLIPRTEGGFWYGPDAIKKMRNRRHTYSPSLQARIDEIVSAYDLWDAKCERLRVEMGVDDLRAWFEEVNGEFFERFFEVVTFRAMTLEGIQAKARLARTVCGPSFNRLIDESGSEEGVDYEITHHLAMSITRDLLALSPVA